MHERDAAAHLLHDGGHRVGHGLRCVERHPVAAVFGDDVPLRDSVRHANRVAGMSTEGHGAAAAMPTRNAVIARFGEN